MKKEILGLTSADYKAVEVHNDNYLLDKGASLYRNEKFAEAIEYYRLAASMGNSQAIANLGYCYMYGNGTEMNLHLSRAYFEMAYRMNNIDATYKLATIYAFGTGVEKDKELAIFYYSEALGLIKGNELEYPNLFFSVSKEMLPGGLFNEDLHTSFHFLNIAIDGFEEQIKHGNDYYEKDLEEAYKMFENKIFDDVKEELEKEEDCHCNHCGDDCDCDECDCD